MSAEDDVAAAAAAALGAEPVEDPDIEQLFPLLPPSSQASSGAPRASSRVEDRWVHTSPLRRLLFVALGVASGLLLCALGQMGLPRATSSAREAVVLVLGTSGESEPRDSLAAVSACNGEVGVPLAWPKKRRWELPDATESVCLEALRGRLPSVGEATQDLKRNWCWEGLKRLGCHRHLAQRLPWRDLGQLAVQAGAALLPDPLEPLLSAETCDHPELGRRPTWRPADRLEAHEWFYNHVEVFVLNLPSNKARWQYSQARLKELFIKATRVDGIDMRAPNAVRDAKQEGLIPEDFNMTRAAADAWSAGLDGMLGRVGCASAHFRTQQRAMAAVPRKPMVLVFEDDVWPEKDFIPRLWSLVHEELPCDWEVVSLSSKCPYGRCISPHLTRVEPDANEPAETCHGGVNYGLQGVLYRTEGLAKLQTRLQRAVFQEGRPQCLDLDVALASISDAVNYYAVPFVQDPGFLTEIHMGSTREIVDQNLGIQSSCSTRPECKDLVGECCPTVTGLMLGCCGREGAQLCEHVESGVDYVADGAWGASVNHVPGPHLCCQLCQQNPNCQAWTWVKDAGLGGIFPGQCWLKGSLPTSTPRKEGVISGLRARGDQPLRPSQVAAAATALQTGADCPQVSEGIEFVVESSWGVHVDHIRRPNQCCARCNQERHCLSWTWVQDARLPQGSPGQCWLKGGGTIISYLKKEGVVSGLRGTSER